MGRQFIKFLFNDIGRRIDTETKVYELRLYTWNVFLAFFRGAHKNVVFALNVWRASAISLSFARYQRRPYLTLSFIVCELLMWKRDPAVALGNRNRNRNDTDKIRVSDCFAFVSFRCARKILLKFHRTFSLFRSTMGTFHYKYSLFYIESFAEPFATNVTR